MFDLILIQDAESGISLFEYRGPAVRFDEEHALLFSGFLTAVQGITSELNIGALVQLSTKSHHCLIHRENRILVLIIIDGKERVANWKRKAKKIGQKFVQRFVNGQFCANNTGCFSQFSEVLERLVKLPRSVHESNS